MLLDPTKGNLARWRGTGDPRARLPCVSALSSSVVGGAGTLLEPDARDLRQFGTHLDQRGRMVIALNRCPGR